MDFDDSPALAEFRAEAAECGLACLAMIAGHHGIETDLQTMRREHAVSLKGSTLKSLIDIQDDTRDAAEFLEHVKATNGDLLEEIRSSKKLSEEAEDKLASIVDDFKKGFATTDGSSVVPDAHVEAMDEADVEKESVQVRKPAPKKK